MADPWAQFKDAPSADPWAQFNDAAPAAPSANPRPYAPNFTGTADAALHFGTAGVAGLAGGLNYLGTLAATRDPQAAAGVQEATQSALTYQPRTAAGQEIVGGVGSALDVAPVAKRFGDWTLDKTGSPALATAAEVLPNAAAQLVPGKLASVVGRGVEGAATSGLLNYKPGFTRTAEAQRLINEGVDLTPGQMNPKGVLNKMEQGWQRVPVVGNIIQAARENAAATFQKSVIEKAAAPGAKITPADVSDMLDQAYQSYAPLYDQAKGFPVKPAIVNQGANVPLEYAFRKAASDRGVQADAATRTSTADWLANKLTALKAKPGAALDSAQLIELRSDIRAQIRKNNALQEASKQDSAALMGNAEQAVTQALESQLPQDALAALRSADAQYGTYKLVENAVSKAKDKPGGFTPENLSQAIKESESKASYARGGGRLRQLSKDAKATIAGTEPQTGAILPVIGAPAALIAAKPLIGVPAAAAALFMTGTRTGRRFAAGTTGLQAGAKNVANALAKQRTFP